MLGQLFQSFTQAPQGQQAIQQLSQQGFAPAQSMGFLQSAFPAAASAFQRARAGGAAGPQGVTDVGSSHYVTNFLSAAVTGLIRGEGIMGAAVDGLQGVVGGHVAQVIATRFGLPQRVAGTVGAIVTPLIIDFLWDRVRGGLDLGSLLGAGGVAAGGAALGAAAMSAVGGGAAPAAGFGAAATGGLAGVAGAAAQALGIGGAAPAPMPASGFGVPASGMAAAPAAAPTSGFGVPAQGMTATPGGAPGAFAGAGAPGAFAGAQAKGVGGTAPAGGLGLGGAAALMSPLAGLGSMLPGGIPGLGAISAAVGTPGAAASASPALGALGGILAGVVMPPTQGDVAAGKAGAPVAGQPAVPVAKGAAPPNAATTQMPDIGSIFRMFGGS